MTADALPPIVTVSAAMQRAVALMERFAPTNLPILLVGETGTGKELFARHIHARSGRRGQFADVNCGALPLEIAESLLFGHRRGAFTGAVESAIGHVERAHEGTLFLDEVLHLPLGSQVKLLRALETGEVQPLGDGRKRRVDLRLVSAAQEDTNQRLSTGGFRRDLYQRLAGVVIELPRLVDRPEDILLLAKHFAGLRGQRLEPKAYQVLRNYSWPGNVRELRLAMERATCLVENGRLRASAVRDAIALGTLREPCGERRTAERRADGSDRRRRVRPRRSVEVLLAACRELGWNAERVAKSLGIGLTVLYEDLKAAGISLRYYRKYGEAEFRRTSAGTPETGERSEL